MDLHPSEMTLRQTIEAGIVDWSARVRHLEAAIPNVLGETERQKFQKKFSEARILMHNRDFLHIAQMHSALCDANMRLPNEKIGW